MRCWWGSLPADEDAILFRLGTDGTSPPRRPARGCHWGELRSGSDPGATMAQDRPPASCPPRRAVARRCRAPHAPLAEAKLSQEGAELDVADAAWPRNECAERRRSPRACAVRVTPGHASVTRGPPARAPASRSEPRSFRGLPDAHARSARGGSRRLCEANAHSKNGRRAGERESGCLE